MRLAPTLRCPLSVTLTKGYRGIQSSPVCGDPKTMARPRSRATRTKAVSVEADESGSGQTIMCDRNFVQSLFEDFIELRVLEQMKERKDNDGEHLAMYIAASNTYVCSLVERHFNAGRCATYAWLCDFREEESRQLDDLERHLPPDVGFAWEVIQEKAHFGRISRLKVQSKAARFAALVMGIPWVSH